MLPRWARVNQEAIMGCFAFPKVLALLEPQHQIVLCHIRTLIGRGLISLQRCSRCILQPQPTGQSSLSLLPGSLWLGLFGSHVLLKWISWKVFLFDWNTWCHKLANCSREWPKHSFFHCHSTEVALFHGHRRQVHSGLERLHLIWFSLWVK